MDAEPDPEAMLAIAYARAPRRAALRALWMLDAKLAAIVRTTREPLIGEIRLTWWHDALAGGGADGGEPLLAELARFAFDRARLAAMATGWTVLLEPMPLAADRLTAYAEGRGASLFSAAGALLGPSSPAFVGDAGRGWALVDLACHCSDRATAALARDLAEPLLHSATRARWPRDLRALGILAHLALRDARAVPETRRRQGSPARLLRALRHAMTGY